MMTKEELKKYLQNNGGTGEAMRKWPVMPTTFSSVRFHNIKDALQIKYEHVNYLDDMATELIDGRGGTIILFDSHAELYTNDVRFYASSNDSSDDGVKLKMLHDAFKGVPRQKGIPEDILSFVKDEIRHPMVDYDKNAVDELVDYLKFIGVNWADELREAAYTNEPKLASTDETMPKSNVVLNASIKDLKNTKASDKISITVDGYIVIDTPVKIFRSQAAMESYRREHKEENTPALFVKDGAILCLQEEVK